MENYISGLITGVILAMTFATVLIFSKIIPDERETTCKQLHSTYNIDGKMCVRGNQITLRW